MTGRFFVAVIGAALLPVSGGAIEPPETALSRATTVPVMLLDDEAGNYVFPQSAVDWEPSLFAYGASGPNNADGGIHLDLFGHDLFYQTRHFDSRTASRTSMRFESTHSQAGWARSLGAARVGAAFTWSIDARRERDLDVEDRSGVHREDGRTRFHLADMQGGAVGFGWKGSFEIDAVFELTTESFLSDLTYRDTFSVPFDSLVIRDALSRDVHMDLKPGGAVRIRVPLREELNLRLFGSVRDVGQDLVVSRTLQRLENGIITLLEEADSTFTSRGSEVAAGFRIEGRRPGSDVGWAAHAWYERIRSGWRYDPFAIPYLRRQQFRTDLGEVGFSVSRPGPAEILFLGGVSIEGSWIRERRETRSPGELLAPEPISLDANSDDRVDFGFGWGASRSFEEIELIASIRATLTPLDPVAYLDVRIPF